MFSFSDLNLAHPIKTAIEKAGYVTPTPIQEQAIPHLLNGRDLLGIAQTGTGKTAAFALPMLDHLARQSRPLRKNHVRSLILTPTRELASQISDSFAIYGRNLRFRKAVIFGGVGQYQQIRSLASGLDVLIATPGRLLDLISQGYARLDDLEIFVLDEADRMLDMGFIHDVRKVISHLPKVRQTLLFSATMPVDISDLAQGLLHDPIRVEVTPPATTVKKVEQKVMFVDKPDKISVLIDLLKNPDITMALVFARTKHGANRISDHLCKCGVSADAIHGNKSQGARERALSDFRNGRTRALVATDIAARGIDVPGVSHVINFDIPNEPESYVHRIGRTARAGKGGIAISLCDADEKLYLHDIQKLVGLKIPVDSDHQFHSEAAAGSPPVKPILKSRWSSSQGRQDNAQTRVQREYRARQRRRASGYNNAPGSYSTAENKPHRSEKGKR